MKNTVTAHWQGEGDPTTVIITCSFPAATAYLQALGEPIGAITQCTKPGSVVTSFLFKTRERALEGNNRLAEILSRETI